MKSLPAADRPGVFGVDVVSTLPNVLAELGATRVLLLTGRKSFAESGAERVLPRLRGVATVQTWSDFSPNPDVDDLVAGTTVFRDFRPDAIVAIGGGSVLDMAKLVATLGDVPADEIHQAVRTNSVPGRDVDLVLLPTTSGSGSEATHFAVVYIGTQKFSVAHPSMLPDYVILDAALTESATRYQKATSVFDAIAQAVESHWARGATDASRAFAKAALADLVPSAAGFVGGDRPAAVQAASGSHLAGRAIDLSKTTGAHALAYFLTQHHGISHGHAVATTLGAFARVHGTHDEASQAADLRHDMDSLAGLLGVEDATQVGDRLDGIASDLGLELRLSALGVPRSDLAAMGASVNQERLANNPVAFSSDAMRELLESCW